MTTELEPEGQTSPMAEMSGAIRLSMERYAPNLRSLPPDVLRDFTHIVGAFYFDLKAELDRRDEGA